MTGFILSRPTKIELLNAVIELEKRGYEVTHQLSSETYMPRGKIYGEPYTRHFVKMRKKENVS